MRRENCVSGDTFTRGCHYYPHAQLLPEHATQNPNPRFLNPEHVAYFLWITLGYEDTVGYGRIQGAGWYSGPCFIFGQVEYANIRP